METTKINLSSTLEELQTDEQRILLDTITKVRKCGLDSIISLPQIVVCGDQSAGKSSVLEALTEIPFPRNDNLCTRFATEISLRCEPADHIKVKIVPDPTRPQDKQDEIKAFSESITDFEDLPAVMDAAMKVMGIAGSDDASAAFAKDTLSIEINGPNRPQLTLVDIPGLIQASTKGVSDKDVAMVKEITDHYISQPRTICLAVVSATNDAANQGILQCVRKFDPCGERTLGIITKPDKLEPGSGSEAKFLELARNEDVFFKLGWHVIRNRKFSEREFSFEERNSSEMLFFRMSNFNTLPKETVGIDALRVRLSHLIHGHVRNELPRLMGDTEAALEAAKTELELLGRSRSTTAECRAYLTQMSMDCHEISKAALDGHYSHEYFTARVNDKFNPQQTSTVARLRAVVQHQNNEFSESIRTRGHKYQIAKTAADELDAGDETKDNDDVEKPDVWTVVSRPKGKPMGMSRSEATAWVKQVILRSRGTELFGSFNPNVVAELFWEQSQPWAKLACDHIEQIGMFCEQFLADVFLHNMPKEVKTRVWSFMVEGSLKQRKVAAHEELAKLVHDLKGFPINYNHYYTDNLHKTRQERLKARLKAAIPSNLEHTSYLNCSRGPHYERCDIAGDLDKMLAKVSASTIPDMQRFACEEALDCLLAIYKVQQKVFVANVATQVIERQMLHGLDLVFAPLAVAAMTDTEVESVARESAATHRQRTFLADRVAKLEAGRGIFRAVVGSVV